MFLRGFCALEFNQEEEAMTQFQSVTKTLEKWKEYNKKLEYCANGDNTPSQKVLAKGQDSGLRSFSAATPTGHSLVATPEDSDSTLTSNRIEIYMGEDVDVLVAKIEDVEGQSKIGVKSSGSVESILPICALKQVMLVNFKLKKIQLKKKLERMMLMMSLQNLKNLLVVDDLGWINGSEGQDLWQNFSMDEMFSVDELLGAMNSYPLCRDSDTVQHLL
ncbi:hypothetical protein K2173_002933 [Erythroxylum novogranatense]|uniref:Uncharacterized protein n=1 Tax=Erythroxylum novogranatense TaxID=1862640 RepID=A0AAV8TUK0_9ROSI|nr:hypothetical protein K2173_002933 [Erythroxylum novogranatense]